MELLEVKTSFVPFPPYLDINDSPVDVFDKLTWSGHFYNHLLKIARLNATVSRSAKMGECLWINNNLNCSGLLKELVDETIDFSLYSQPFNSYDDKDLFSQLKISQMTSEVNHVFMSTAQEPSKINEDVSPFNIFSRFPVLIIILNFVVLFVVVFFINFRSKSRDKRIDIVDAFVVHTLHWSRCFHGNHRRIISASLLIYCFFSYYFYSGRVCSDMIVSIPEKFFTSITDVVKSNRTPAFFDGLALKNDFVHSKDKNKLLLIKRAAERGTLYSSMASDVLLSLSAGIAESGDVGMLDDRSIAINIRALVCLPLVFSQNVTAAIEIPKIKITRIGDFTGHSGYLFAKNIDPQVRQRIEYALYLLIESGQFMKMMTDPVPQLENTPNVNREQLIYCLTNMGTKKSIKKANILFQLAFILFFVKAGVLAIIIAFMCLLYENITFRCTFCTKNQTSKRTITVKARRRHAKKIILVVPNTVSERLFESRHYPGSLHHYRNLQVSHRH